MFSEEGFEWLNSSNSMVGSGQWNAQDAFPYSSNNVTAPLAITLTINTPQILPELAAYIPSIKGNDPLIGFNGSNIGNGSGDGRDELVPFSFAFPAFQSIQSARLTLDLTTAGGLITTDELLFADNNSIRGEGNPGAQFYGNALLRQLSSGTHQTVTFDLLNIDARNGAANLGNLLLDGDLHVVYGDDAIIHSARLEIAGIPEEVNPPMEGHIYFLTDPESGTSWTDTEEQAVDAGGHLVTINDAAENQWLVDRFGTSESFWIGLNDVRREGQFEWVSGERSTYRNWAAGEPNDLEEDYAELNPSFAPGQWNDRSVDASEFGGRGIVEVVSAVTGTTGDDVFYARGSDVTIAGDLGNDIIYGDVGRDVLRGDRNADWAGGRIGGDDTLHGGGGGDRLGGKGGNDELYGDGDADQLWGDAGDDLLWGGTGNDTLNGGVGADTFVLARGEGTDQIKDFQRGLDKLGLANGLTFNQLAFSSSGNLTLIRQGSEVLAQITGRVTLTSTDFVLI